VRKPLGNFPGWRFIFLMRGFAHSGDGAYGIRRLNHWGHGFEFQSRHGCMHAGVFPCYVVVCRQKPCDGSLPSPRGPMKRLKIQSFKLILSRKRQQGLIRDG
jgi:hypothetical protein